MTVAPILVTGAAGGSQGSTGFHVTRLLLDTGRPVRAFVHRLDDHPRLQALGAEVVEGDLGDFRSVSDALDGIHRAYSPIRCRRDCSRPQGRSPPRRARPCRAGGESVAVAAGRPANSPRPTKPATG